MPLSDRAALLIVTKLAESWGRKVVGLELQLAASLVQMVALNDDARREKPKAVVLPFRGRG